MRNGMVGRLAALGLGMVLATTLGTVPAAAEPAKRAFGAAAGPSEQSPDPIGSYAKGCLAGGQRLIETARGWQAMRLSRNRNWGHPAMIAFIERLSEEALGIGWPRIYVGDISQPRGGPMLTGHRSHQIGLDADIWLRRPSAEPLSRAQREQIGSHNVVAASGRDVNGLWTPGHHALIRAAASDAAVARIFVNPAIKVALCRGEPAGSDRAWLRKVRPWWGHDSHFHVRLSCPAGALGCTEQAPPPEGDGCGRELSSWFEPPPPSSGTTVVKKRRGELTLADLPAACRTVLR